MMVRIPFNPPILDVVLSMILLFISASVFGTIEILEENGELISYIIYDIFIAVACFYICKNKPGSVWYVPLISNAIGITAAIIETNFWKTDMWILFCSGWLLSLFGAFIGAFLGRRKVKSL